MDGLLCCSLSGFWLVAWLGLRWVGLGWVGFVWLIGWGVIPFDGLFTGKLVENRLFRVSPMCMDWAVSSLVLAGLEL